MQKVKFDGQEGVSQPDVYSEGTEAELKLFRRLIFKGAQYIKYYQSSFVMVTLPSLTCKNSYDFGCSSHNSYC